MMDIKKRIIKVLLITILLFLIFGHMVNKVDAYTVNNINGNSLSTGENINIYDTYMDFPQLYCVQRGKKVVSGGSYKVGESITVQDPVLAYILANTNMGATESYWISGRQIALWRYLSEYSSGTDAKNILSGITSNVPKVCNTGSTWRTCTVGHKSAGSCIYENYWRTSTKILNDAKEYAKNIKACSINVSEPEINGTYLEFEISGSYDSFKIKIDGKEITNYSTSGKKVKVNISGLASVSKLEVIAYKKMYKV